VGQVGRGAPRGETAHVAPMKLNLQPPGSELLKLKCDGPLSNFAFNFNLRRYTEVVQETLKCDPLYKPPHGHRALVKELKLYIPVKVGRCRVTLSNPSLKRLEVSA